MAAAENRRVRRDGAVVTEERPDGNRVWLTFAMSIPVKASLARAIVESCLGNVRGTWGEA